MLQGSYELFVRQLHLAADVQHVNVLRHLLGQAGDDVAHEVEAFARLVAPDGNQQAL